MTSPTAEGHKGAFSRSFWIAFALTLLVAVLPLWLVEYLPMIDLPQHMAQLSIGQHWDDPAYRYQDLYQVNWVISHVMSRLVAGFFAQFTSVQIAMKLLVSLSIIGLPASVAWLLYRLRADPFWALPTFVTSFGFSFCWGFVDFMFAVPLGVLLIAEGHDYVTSPTRRRALKLAFWSWLCFASHSLVLGWAGLLVATMIALGTMRHTQRLLGLVALGSPLPALAGVLWLALPSTQSPSPPVLDSTPKLNQSTPCWSRCNRIAGSCT